MSTPIPPRHLAITARVPTGGGGASQVTKSQLRKREHGKLWFEDRWSIADPATEALGEAMYELRHGGGTPEQLRLVLGAADAYRHLCCYPLRTVARRQFDDICRALRSGMAVAEERKG